MRLFFSTLLSDLSCFPSVLHVPPNQAGTQQLSPDSGVVVLERTGEYS